MGIVCFYYISISMKGYIMFKLDPNFKRYTNALINVNHTNNLGSVELYAEFADYYHFNMSGSINVPTSCSATDIYNLNKRSINAFNNKMSEIEIEANAKGYKTRVTKITIDRIAMLMDSPNNTDGCCDIYGDIWIDNPASPDNGMGY